MKFLGGSAEKLLHPVILLKSTFCPQLPYIVKIHERHFIKPSSICFCDGASSTLEACSPSLVCHKADTRADLRQVADARCGASRPLLPLQANILDFQAAGLRVGNLLNVVRGSRAERLGTSRSQRKLNIKQYIIGVIEWQKRKEACV